MVFIFPLWSCIPTAKDDNAYTPKRSERKLTNLFFKNDKKSNLSKKAGFTERDKGHALAFKEKK